MLSFPQENGKCLKTWRSAKQQSVCYNIYIIV